ncbi:MAG: hypothetical protein EB015_02140 [Methylocystaceae bacterium]|nr:hypothetical protein [Methylocystaceae bacterium]
MAPRRDFLNSPGINRSRSFWWRGDYQAVPWRCQRQRPLNCGARNPSSGAKGSFTPIGQAFPLEGKICRAFTAEILANQEEERLEGAACREKSEDWALTEIKTAKKT